MAKNTTARKTLDISSNPGIAALKALPEPREKASKIVKVKKERKVRELSQTDRILAKVIEEIRSDRSKFKADEETSTDMNNLTKSFTGRIGSAEIRIGRTERVGRKSAVVARAFVTIKADSSEKVLDLSGGLAAKAWWVVNHQPKGRGKTIPESADVDAAMAALGI